MMNNWIRNVRIEKKEYINRFMMYPSINKMVKPIWSENIMISARKVYEGKYDIKVWDRSQVGFRFIFMVSDSDSQFRIRKSNTKLENLKVILWCFKEN